MNASRNEDYVDFALAFQSLLVDQLNSVLKDRGMDEEIDRREVCEAFLAGLGDTLDQHWIDVDGERAHPILAFSENHLGPNTALPALGAVLFPSEAFANREYVYGTVADFYEDHHESTPGITTGSVLDDEDEFYDDGEPDEW